MAPMLCRKGVGLIFYTFPPRQYNPLLFFLSSYRGGGTYKIATTPEKKA